MNKPRRNKIAEIVSRLEAIRADLDNIREDEQYYLYSVPENLQNSERYQRSEEAVSDMENVDSSLEDIIDQLNDIIEQ